MSIFTLDQFVGKDWLKPFILSGLTAFGILTLLALTSFRFSQHRLPWKKIHRLVYFTIPLLAVHIWLKEEGQPDKVAYLFLPLIGAEAYRFYLFFNAKGRN